MDELAFLVLLLPVVFMIHDFEEIILLRVWLRRSGGQLSDRFPPLDELLTDMRRRSTAAFALGVAEEFVLISLVSFAAVYFGYYYIWLAVFVGFSLHLVVHLVQWMVFRSYIPAIVTTFLCLPYVIYVVWFLLNEQLFTVTEMLLWGSGGFLVIALNLWLVYKLMAWFDRLTATDDPAELD